MWRVDDCFINDCLLSMDVSIGCVRFDPFRMRLSSFFSVMVFGLVVMDF